MMMAGLAIGLLAVPASMLGLDLLAGPAILVMAVYGLVALLPLARASYWSLKP